MLDRLFNDRGGVYTRGARRYTLTQSTQCKYSLLQCLCKIFLISPFTTQSPLFNKPEREDLKTLRKKEQGPRMSRKGTCPSG